MAGLSEVTSNTASDFQTMKGSPDFGEPFDWSPSVAQAPRSVVQALTQSSWLTHVVAASVSAQSACGVLQ